MARANDYLRTRSGSSNLSVRFQYPTEELRMVAEMILGRPVKADESWSTKTANRDEALLIAGRAIEEHRKIMLAFDAFSDPAQSWGTLVRRKRMIPHRCVNYHDGSRVLSTENEISYVAPDGRVTTLPNDDVYELKVKEELVAAERKEALDEHSCRTRPKLKDADLAVIDAYIDARKNEGKMRKDDEDCLRRTLQDFKSITGDRLINQSSRKDVVALIDHLRGAYDLSSQRVKRLVAQIKAAVNYDMHDHRNTIYQYNVFANVPIGGDDDAEDRSPFTEPEMRHIRENMSMFSGEGALMFVWHASSSIRPVGLYSIVEDGWEDGEDPDTNATYRTRFVKIRKDKGKYGKRSLAIPQAVLDMGVLPDTIRGPIFKTPRPQLLVHIGTKLDKMGVEKSLYSARHRAKDRLLGRGCESDMRKAIMGHARRVDAHDIYGHGYAQWQLKPWIDKIGA